VRREVLSKAITLHDAHYISGELRPKSICVQAIASAVMMSADVQSLSDRQSTGISIRPGFSPIICTASLRHSNLLRA